MGKLSVFLDVLAPWIIDSWLEVLSGLSFDIPTLQLDRYQQHIAIAATAIFLLMLGWHSVGNLPFKARAPLLALLTLTLLAPFAILTVVHFEAIAQLPQFAGRLRKPANAEPAIQTQRLPEAVALPQTIEPTTASAPPSPAPEVLVAAPPPPRIPVTEAARAPSPPPQATASQATAPLAPAPTTTQPLPAPTAAASATIKRVATNLSQLLPGAAKTELMPVFYGTDRLVDPAAAPRPAYTTQQTGRLELGRAYIQIPRRHHQKQGDRPWIAALPQATIAKLAVAATPGLDLDKQFVIADLKSLSGDEFLEQTVMRLASSQRYKDHALVFIPGFNISFENGLHRAAQLAYDLKFDGAPFVYSWPSDGASANYTHDSHAVTKASATFAEFLQIVVSQTGAKSVSVIAHGLGTLLTLDVLASMKNKIPAGVTIRELILSAPDIDASTFKSRVAALSGLPARTTLYVASTDRALNISRRYTGGIPRAGDLLSGGPLVIQGIDTVDVSVAGTQALGLNHPDYVDQSALIRDIALRLGSPGGGQSASLESIPTPTGPYLRRR